MSLGATWPAVRDRVMVFAPHPDDESIAAGGLIAAAAARGIAVRVVFVTDGENNPWAQRAFERRWGIGAEERRRWGERRRLESLRALACLGVAAGSARFLGYPDQFVTDCLLAAPRAIVGRIADVVAAWRPTLIVAPSLEDRHPDHAATAIAIALAVSRPEIARSRPRLLHYQVHGPAGALPRSPAIVLPLGPAERGAKRLAILSHASQLRLRRGFLTGFDRSVERFTLPAAGSGQPQTTGPIRGLRACGAQWRFALRHTLRGGLGDGRVALVSQGDGGIACMRFTPPRRSGRYPLHEGCGGVIVGEVHATVTAVETRFTITAAALASFRVGLVKLDLPRERRLGLFDHWSWVSVPSAEARAGLRSVVLRPSPVGTTRREAGAAARVPSRVGQGAGLAIEAVASTPTGPGR